MTEVIFMVSSAYITAGLVWAIWLGTGEKTPANKAAAMGTIWFLFFVVWLVQGFVDAFGELWKFVTKE